MPERPVHATAPPRGDPAGGGRPWLAPATFPFRLVVGLRGLLYDHGLLPTRQLPVPTISVGNLSVGGTGKTPIVETLVRFLASRWLRPAILSRGYGGGDEVRALEEALPGIPQGIGSDRYLAGLEVLDRGPVDVFVLDDGFQHRRLHRDLDLVVVDATRLPWDDRLLPAGRLREPVSALARAGAVVLTRTESVPGSVLEAARTRIARHSEAPVAHAETHPTGLVALGGSDFAGPEWLAGKRVAAFCGIGNPQAFRRNLEAAGAAVVAFRAFRDHQAYGPREIAGIAGWAEEARARGAEAILTTAKDAVKLKLRHDVPGGILVLRAETRLLDGRDAVESAILAALEGRRRA